MNTQGSLNAPRVAAPFAGISSAARQMDGMSLSALVAIFIGWFFVDSLVVGLGSLQHGVRFFDISSAIGDPTRIFFGVEGSFRRVLFGSFCLICLLLPILPHWQRSLPAWAAYFAPLVLMLICGALLYSKTSGEFFSVGGDARSLGGSAIRFANDLMRQGSGRVARHVSIGGGGYLAFAGCLVLAAQGLRRIRRHAP